MFCTVETFMKHLCLCRFVSMLFGNVTKLAMCLKKKIETLSLLYISIHMTFKFHMTPALHGLYGVAPASSSPIRRFHLIFVELFRKLKLQYRHNQCHNTINDVYGHNAVSTWKARLIAQAYGHFYLPNMPSPSPCLSLKQKNTYNKNVQ
jgi:hypothetical protein